MRHTYTRSLLFILAIFALSSAIVVLGVIGHTAEASAPSGLPATIASTTAEVVLAASAVNIAATSSCAARIISTTQQGIMLTLSDYAGQTPTQTFGLWQAASTTVVYDSGQYGCGLIKAISGGGANSNVTVVVSN